MEWRIEAGVEASMVVKRVSIVMINFKFFIISSFLFKFKMFR